MGRAESGGEAPRHGRGRHLLARDSVGGARGCIHRIGDLWKRAWGGLRASDQSEHGTGKSWEIPERVVSIKRKEVMSVDEVADYLQVSVWTVYKYAQDGALPCKKIGGQWRFRRRDIDKLFEDDK